MSNQFVDLHSHSTASDGTLAPTDVVRRAHEAGLVGMSLTDHDTVAGVAEAGEEAKRLGLVLVPGIEISAVSPVTGGTLHILGYCVDVKCPVLIEMMQTLVEARNDRNPRIVARLRELGIDITLDEVEQEAGGDVVGRPHIANILVRKGVVSSIKQAFNEYLGEGGKAFFEKNRLVPRVAIEKIRQAGGIAAIAHPVQLRAENDGQLERVLKDLVDAGLEGIEVIHSDHSDELVEKYTKLAKRYGLLMTGGSDFHGDLKYNIQIGVARGRKIPREMMDRLIERAQTKRVVT